MQQALANPDSIVVDARISSAYLGWPTDGITRGGHIPGATDFSARWLTCTYRDTDNPEGENREQVLTQYMLDKNITADKQVILYDANGTDAQTVAAYFMSKGVADVSVYDVNQWAAEDALLLESAPGYGLLVPAVAVNDLIDGKTPETFLAGVEHTIFHVASGQTGQSEYLAGHVPGAIYVDTDWFAPAQNSWKQADDDALLALLHKLGVSSGDSVIVTAPDPMASTRFAVVLSYMGVTDVRVMAGGLTEWSDLGYPLETGHREPHPSTNFGAGTPANPHWIDTRSEVAAALGTTAFTLVDNRTWEEFSGDSTGYDAHDKAGRINGAVFGYAGKKNADSMSYYRSIDKTMRNPDEIAALWRRCGIDPTQHLTFMCGNGWRAAEVLWYARVMGHEAVSLYAGGWIDWSSAGLPTVVGAPAGGRP